MLPFPVTLLWDGLTWFSQVSVAVPLLLWARRGRLHAPLGPLVAYAWLALGGGLLVYPGLPRQSYQFGLIILLNLAKIGLFAAVYFRRLHRPAARYGGATLAVATLLGGAMALWPPDMEHQRWVASYARLGQCAVLAAFAISYLEQLLSASTVLDLSRDPIFLLSVGQLLYSALTVGYFSLVSGPQPAELGEVGFGLVAVAGLIFNGFLTVTFYYGSEPPPAAPQP